MDPPCTWDCGDIVGAREGRRRGWRGGRVESERVLEVFRTTGTEVVAGGEDVGAVRVDGGIEGA
jgi:hypothetical protein